MSDHIYPSEMLDNRSSPVPVPPAAADVTALFEDMAARIVDGATAFDQWTGQDGHATWNAEQFVSACRSRLAALLGTDEGRG